MFENAMDLLEKGAVRKRLLNGDLGCPECGGKAESFPAEWDQALECKTCGTKASLSEWAANTREDELEDKVTSPPEDTKIRKSGDGWGGVIWHIPPSGKFLSVLVLGIFWCSVTGFASAVTIFSMLGGKGENSDMPWWMAVIFFGIFWAIGLGILSEAIKLKFLYHTVVVSGGELTVRKEMFGRKSEKSLKCSEIKTIEKKEFYRQNKQPVYGIEIKADRVKLKFGSGLGKDEKAWLISDLQDEVFGARKLSKPKSPSREQEGWKSAFSYSIPGAKKGSWVSGLVMSVMGLGFVGIGIFGIAGSSWPKWNPELGVENILAYLPALFSDGFATVWILFSSFFVLIGMMILYATIQSRGVDRRIEGNASDISIRRYQRGKVLVDQSFPRKQVSDIRSSVSGKSNGKDMKRLELIVNDRVVKIARWIDGDAADALVSKVRQALGI